MRITCTNCDAQYEVDGAAIPPAGRDVQCSNCGHSWFQMHPMAEAEAEAERALFSMAPLPEEASPEPVPAPADPAPPEATEPPQEALPGPEVAAARSDPPEDEARPPPPRPRRAIDDSVLAVLREEAERETRARAAEAARGIETQPDLGLEATVRAMASAPDVPEKADEAPVENGTTPAEKPVTQRRDLLPDIDVINSTLRAGSEARGDAGPDEAEAPMARRGGFRTGFTFMLVVGVILLSVYVMAPRIAAIIPAAEPTLGAYVRAIDAGRLWLDGMIQMAAQAVRGGS